MPGQLTKSDINMGIKLRHEMSVPRHYKWIILRDIIKIISIVLVDMFNTALIGIELRQGHNHISVTL